MDQHGADYNNIVRVNVIVSCRAVLCWASTLFGSTGVQISHYIAILAIEIFIWRLMQQILAIVTQTVNMVHVQNSSRIVYSLVFFIIKKIKKIEKRNNKKLQ